MLLAIVKGLVGGVEAAREQPADPPTDEELMLRYAGGDVEAFEVLVSRHERALFYFILKSCANRARAEEILQEVFLRIIRHAKNYKPSAKFTTWAYTITRNLCVDAARKRGRASEISLDAPAGKDSDSPAMVDGLPDTGARASSVELERKTFRRRLSQALDALPAEQREVFILREFSGLKFHEIAEATGTKVPTVKSRMRYALKALRGHLADYLGQSFDEDEAEQMLVRE